MQTQRKSLLLAAFFSAVTMSAAAKAPPEEVAKLGAELTPVGAIRAGNEDGTIPAWEPRPQEGPLKGFWPSYPDLDAEKPLFTISAENNNTIIFSVEIMSSIHAYIECVS